MSRALAMLVLLGGCAIVDDELPGAPCRDDDDCPASFACIEDVCVPGDVVDNNEPIIGCDGAADGADCSDGDACSEDDACSGGACIGSAVQCDANEVCSSGVCVDLGECTLAGTAERMTNTPGVSASASVAYDPERNQIAVAFDDDVTGLSEIFVQLLDGDDASPIGAAVQVTDGVPATENDTDRNSFQPHIVYAPEQDEYAVAWTAIGGDIIGIGVEVFAVTLTSSLVPATTHDLLKAGLNPAFSVGPATIAATGAGYAVAWVDDRNTTKSAEAFDVFFARLEDDGELVSITNQQISPGDEVGGNIALAFNPRTTDFATAYRVVGSPGSLFLTLTNIDGEAARDFVVNSTGNPFEPAIALTSTGYAIAWRDDDATEGALGPIDFALVDDDGNAAGQRRLTDDGELCGRPSLVAVPGGFALAYAALVTAPDVLEVRMRLLDAAGTPGPARVLGNGQRPSQVALPTGVAAAWQQINGEESDVFATAQCLSP